MPDISMCLAENCERSKECYRFMAVPNEYQAYTMFQPKNDGTGCNEFLPIEGRRVK